ncbi:MAG: pseudaminic acid synthase [Candidatus Margulisiibacteriota bacterium]|nr:pseudaminic acid synthase [Candidatus Margulisiibacteriota bacterium]
MKKIKIGKNKYIGEKEPCFIIAEMSANHAQDLKIAKKIIRAAKKSGADAVKIQTYTPDTMTIPSKRKWFMVKHPKWGGQSLYDLYKKAYTPWKWHKDLKKVAEDEGVALFSTPFDKSAVDFLQEQDVPVYKVASFELVDIPLLKYIAQTGKPVIMSTGMANLQEIKEAVAALRKHGCEDLVLLKCVSSYPADPSDMNIKTIEDLRERFKVHVGLSDHSLGIGVAIASVVLGAKVIEKHFTISRKIKNPDSFFSIEPGEMGDLVKNVRLVEKAIGKRFYGLTQKEKMSKVFRRSIFIVKDTQKGELFNEGNLRIVRPSNGMKPKHYEAILGRKARKTVKAGTPLGRSMYS